MDTRLYIVPTPIGNLADMTYRAVNVLREADTILAEDTRTSGKLLSHYGISTPVQSYHMFNEHKTLQFWIDKLKSGWKLALISDAGTPGISDPGFLLVRECVANGIEVETLPGATALIPALVNSGLPSGRFVFEGFLPVKKGRKKRLEQIAGETRTVILYESPHRIVKTLSQLAEYCGGDRAAAVSRELTKIHEETIRGTLHDLVSVFSGRKNKGEFVIVIHGK